MSNTAIECGNLRVLFWQAGDRYAHRIEVRDGDRWLSALESVEGSPDETWPSSPPLQHLHIEPRGAGERVALLVGMAGKSHWSASVCAAPDQAGLMFDVACRVATAPERLGSCYRELPGARLVQVVPGMPLMVESMGDLLDLRANHAVAPPVTARWSYVVRAASAEG